MSHPSPEPGVTLRGQDGLTAVVEQVVDDKLIARLRDGRRILVRRDTLEPTEEGFYLELTTRDVDAAVQGQGLEVTDQIVIPVIEESVHVGTEKVDVGQVRIVKRVETRDEEIEHPTTRESVEVERVEVNEVVADIDNPPQARDEGDVLIIPVLEEVVVVEKRLVLKEEVHIKKQRTEHTDRQTVTLRQEHVQVAREAASTDD